jgi:hypothetical protein
MAKPCLWGEAVLDHVKSEQHHSKVLCFGQLDQLEPNSTSLYVVPSLLPHTAPTHSKPFDHVTTDRLYLTGAHARFFD